MFLVLLPWGLLDRLDFLPACSTSPAEMSKAPFSSRWRHSRITLFSKFAPSHDGGHSLLHVVSKEVFRGWGGVGRGAEYKGFDLPVWCPSSTIGHLLAILSPSNGNSLIRFLLCFIFFIQLWHDRLLCCWQGSCLGLMGRRHERMPRCLTCVVFGREA